MNRRILLSLAILALCGTIQTASSQTAAADSALRLIETEYLAGRYQSAEVEGRRLLEEASIPDSARAMAEKWVAFSLAAQGRSSLAIDHFRAVLRLLPGFDLDPVLTSPKILSVFRDAQASVVPGTSSAPYGPIGRPVSFRTVVFPGWEQLYQGRTTEGSVFLGAGVVTLGAGITLEFLRSSARKEYLAAVTLQEIEGRYKRYDRYYRQELAAFIAFASVYVASQVDLFVFHGEASLSFSPTGMPDPRLALRIPL